MDNYPKPNIQSLDALRQEKAKLRNELRKQRAVMNETASNLFAPLAPAANKGAAIMRAFNTGMAVFDGVMLGIKMMRQVRRLFRRR